MARKRRAGRHSGAADAAGSALAASATRTCSYAIRDHEAGTLRPVLTVSGSEEHRDEWIARAIAIAFQSAASAEQPMVWEAELGPAGTALGPYALVYPEPENAQLAGGRSGHA